MKAHICHFNDFLSTVTGLELLGTRIPYNYSNPLSSPLHSLHEQAGARFIVFGHGVWVERFNDTLDMEYYALNQKAAVTDVSNVTMLRMSGANVLAKVGSYFTNLRLSCKPQRMYYGGFVTKQGMLFDDGIIYIKSENEIIITVNADYEEFIQIFANDEHMNDLCIQDLTEQYVKLQLQGPHAEAIMRKLYPFLPNITFFQFYEIDNGFISRCGFTKPGGYEIFLPVEAGRNIWSRALHLGAKPFGLSTMEISRVEARMICYGHEFGFGSHRPDEIGFINESNLTNNKGVITACYFLQQPPEQIMENPRIGDLIKNNDGLTVGVLTSAVYSPFYHCHIGFCQINSDTPQNGILSINNSPITIEPINLMAKKKT